MRCIPILCKRQSEEARTQILGGESFVKTNNFRSEGSDAKNGTIENVERS